jgi:hypothetical protein
MALGMFSRSVVSQIPLTLQWSKVTESVTGYRKERRKLKKKPIETKVEKEERRPKWKERVL